MTNQPEQIFEEYRLGNDFKSSIGNKGLFEQTAVNERFYIGNQWYGAKCPNDRPLVRHNVIKRIGDYAEARSINAVSVANPIQPEVMNYLSENFYSYFTSDGYSNSFRLPFPDIYNGNIICRIYYDIDRYAEWIVYEDNSSAKTNFMGQEIVFNINRQNGRFNFTCNGQNYSVPIINTYGENNIRILAGLNNQDNFNNVVSCKKVLQSGNFNVLADGIDKNKIYYSDYENPLYFPVVNNNSIGVPEKKIVTLKENSKQIYIFKEDSLYSLNIKQGRVLNNTAILADNGKKFTKSVDYQIECISKSNGCENPKNAEIYNDKPIWVSNNNKIYRMSSNNIRENEISANIQPLLETINNKNIICVNFENLILFCYDNNVLVLEQKDNEANWFFWEFPVGTKILGSVCNGKDSCLICSNNEMLFTAILSGDKDIIPDGNTENKILVENLIEKELKADKIRLINLGERARINKIFVKLNPQNRVRIKVGNPLDNQIYNISKSDFNKADQGVWLNGKMYPFGDLKISFKTTQGICLGDTLIYFKCKK